VVGKVRARRSFSLWFQEIVTRSRTDIWGVRKIGSFHQITIPTLVFAVFLILLLFASTFLRWIVIGEALEMQTANSHKNVICILVEFNDVPHVKGINQMRSILDEMRAFWHEASYGLLDLSSTVAGWYSLPHSMEYYGKDRFFVDVGIRNLIADAIDLADRDVNFSSYDFIIIVHSGSGQEIFSLITDLIILEDSSRIWSCAIQDLDIQTNDGIIIDHVAVLPEKEEEVDITYYGITLYEGKSFGTLGVFAHEFGHLLGLPDLYDSSILWGDDTFVGDWSLMGSGAALNELRTPCHPMAWSKIKLGWIIPETISPTSSVEAIFLNPLATNREKSALLIPLPNFAYYIVEFRVRIGFDRHLPNEGIIITFVDESDTENPYVRVIDQEPLTSTKDDAVFQLYDRFDCEGFHLIVTHENESCCQLVLSSQPFPDSDNDELVDLVEELLGTDPLREDSDADGLLDYQELMFETNPVISDSDEDGVNDGREFEIGTLPLIPDTDGDWWRDGLDPFPTDNRFPNWILLLVGLFLSPLPLSFAARKLSSTEEETCAETISYRGAGVFMLILALLSSYGAISLLSTIGVSIFPPFSYYVWILIGIGILMLFGFGFLLVIQGKNASRARITPYLQKFHKNRGASPQPRASPQFKERLPSKPTLPYTKTILAIHEEGGLTHIHWAVGDPPEITQEESRALFF